MRTADQIKRKMNELARQKQSLQSQLTNEAAQSPAADRLQAQLERMEDMIVLLEWVLEEPSGKYHA